MRLTIPIPNSMNKYLGNSHSHRIYARDKEAVRWQVKSALSVNGEKPKDPIKRAKVTLTYHFRDKRRRDPDNYSGKFILDALVREGVLADDSFDCVTLVLDKGAESRTSPCVEIFVEEKEEI